MPNIQADSRADRESRSAISPPELLYLVDFTRGQQRCGCREQEWNRRARASNSRIRGYILSLYDPGPQEASLIKRRFARMEDHIGVFAAERVGRWLETLPRT